MSSQDTAGTDAKATAHEAREDAARVREELREEGAAMRGAYEHGKERAREEARSFAKGARRRAEDYADEQRNALSRWVGDYAAALRRAGQELEDRDQGLAARLTSFAADSVEDASASIADTSPGEVLRGVRDFGRRNPAVFITGSVIAGLALARFARSSGERRHDPRGDRYDRDRWAEEDRWGTQPDPGAGAGTSAFTQTAAASEPPSAAHPASGEPVRGTHPTGSGAAVWPSDPVKPQES